MINVSTLTNEQIKHIAKLVSNDRFEFDDCKIERERTSTCVRISEARTLFTRQEVYIETTGVMRQNYDLRKDSCSPEYIHNIIELGKYLETIA